MSLMPRLPLPALLAAAGLLGATAGSAQTATSPAPPAPKPATTAPALPVPAAPALVPQPEGPVPPGKVWSPEHGHWHDVPGASPPIQIVPQGGSAPIVATPAPGTLTPQPEGPVPPGKVWSPEHGHWHDDPAQRPATPPIQLVPQDGSAPIVATPMPGTLTPQPEGPVPPGKVWSPEHGHWHDDPAQAPAAPPIQLVPQDGSAPIVATPATPPLTPQPEGPVPPGKVWSPEHGHWHDLPPAPPAPAAAAAPAPVIVTPAAPAPVAESAPAIEPAAEKAPEAEPPAPRKRKPVPR